MGRPKALISIDGATLLERTARLARSANPDVVLLGRPTHELPLAVRGLPLIEDHPADCGPMGGLSGFFNARSGDDCLLLACDMPRLDSALLSRLGESAADDVDAVVPRCDAGDEAIHPCCAVYRATCAGAVFDAVSAGRFAMRDLLDRLRVRWLWLESSEAAWVENVNTPADASRIPRDAMSGLSTESMPKGAAE